MTSSIEFAVGMLGSGEPWSGRRTTSHTKHSCAPRTGRVIG